MADVLLFLCADGNLASPTAALQASLSDLLAAGAPPVRRIEPDASVLEAADAFLDGGAHTLVVPVRERRPRAGELCWLTLEDLVRFFLSFHRALRSNRLPLRLRPRRRPLGRPRRRRGRRRALRGPAPPHRLGVARRRGGRLRRVPARVRHLAVMDFRFRRRRRVPRRGRRGALGGRPAGVRRLGRRAARRRPPRPPIPPPPPRHAGPALLVRPRAGVVLVLVLRLLVVRIVRRRRGGVRQHQNVWVREAGMGRRRAEEAIVCHRGRSLVAVMVQAMAHRATQVWVVEGEDHRDLVGVVGLLDVLRMLRNHLNQPPIILAVK